MNKLNGKITANATLRGAMTRGAGGGTYVEANPEGEATDTLEKLMVENDIFEIRNVPDASSAQNGSVLTKTTNGVVWAPLPETGIKYTTNEQEIGTWLNGKKLYQKTIHIIENIEQTVKQYNISELVGAPFFNIVNSILKFGVNGGNNWNTPYFIDSQYNADVNITNTINNNLTIISNGWNFTEAYITIQYTKVGE